MTDAFRCACGRIWEFPGDVQVNRHIVYTLICDCARVYTVSHGCVVLRNKPLWPWKRRRREDAHS